MGSYWQPEILSEVVRRLEDGELYLFAGAGLSCLAKYPSWGELLGRFADEYRRLPTRKPEIENILDEMVSKKQTDILDHIILDAPYGEAIIPRVLEKAFAEERTSEVHKMLIDLPFAGYLTTNYDRSLEKACESVARVQELTKQRWFCFPKHKCASCMNYGEIFNGSRFLLHIHGCLYCENRIDSRNIILTRFQYQEFYKQKELEDIYNKLFYKPLLIFGASFTDPWFLNRLFEARGPHDPDLIAERKPCYLVLPVSEKHDLEASQKEIYGVEFNYFDKDDNNAIENMVRELKDKCEQTVRVP